MPTHFSCASSAAEPLKFPNWQDLYHSAVLEIDRPKLLKCVQAAEAAILKRLEFLPATLRISSHQAMIDALGTLRFLGLGTGKRSTLCRKLS
jgi:hypothetical protein